MPSNAKFYYLLALILFFIGCGTSELGTGVGNPPASGKAAAAVAAVFSNDASASVNFIGVRLIKSSFALNGCSGSPVDCMCTDLIAGTTAPENVTEFAYGSAGTFGAADDSVSITEADYCALESGEQNSGSGSDSLGLFGAFVVDADVVADCGSDSEIIMQMGSYGVFRNQESQVESGTYYSEIFGRIGFLVDGESVELDCTMQIDTEDQTLLSASCSDSNGDAIDQDLQASCQL